MTLERLLARLVYAAACEALLAHDLTVLPWQLELSAQLGQRGWL